MEILNEISGFMQKGRAPQVKELTQKALDEGIEANVILEQGLLAGMDIIGEKFKKDEIFIPQVLVAARAMAAGTEILKPHLAAEGGDVKSTIILGTVKGDLHDIGKNLVRMMFEGKGFEVVDLGVDVPAEKFVEAVKEHNAPIVACSALLTSTMDEMKVVVDAFKDAGLRDNVKIMIGGAPVNQDFCELIGADCYTEDAASAAEAAVAFIQE